MRSMVIITFSLGKLGVVGGLWDAPPMLLVFLGVADDDLGLDEADAL